MYTLHYSPGACSLIVHVLLEELGLAFELQKADGKPGSWERARTLERMATMATEMQPVFNRYFHADDFSTDEAVQAAVKAHAATKLIAWFRAQDAALATPYWSGHEFDAADIFFTVMTRWGRWLDPPANEMPNIRPVYERVITRPSFARAMQREGVKAFGTA